MLVICIFLPANHQPAESLFVVCEPRVPNHLNIAKNVPCNFFQRSRLPQSREIFHEGFENVHGRRKGMDTWHMLSEMHGKSVKNEGFWPIGVQQQLVVMITTDG